MKKIRLSDTDLELFDIEISPSDYMFFQRHKDAFKTMFREQGKPFWTRFTITFRSFTVKHGVIRQMNIDSPKFQNLIDEAFICIHEKFVDARENMAKNFIEDIAKLAQSQDKFHELDSKSFSKDPFYHRDTRELFRNFFGAPDQKSSYLKVYILCPVYLRFGGSICRCLLRWIDAPIQLDPEDNTYWIQPQSPAADDTADAEAVESVMCTKCLDESSEIYFREKIMGALDGPRCLDFWTLGDPRFNDSENPLFAPHQCPASDWRELLTVDIFRNFYNYARYKYGADKDKCSECQSLKKKRDKFIHVCRVSKQKKKKEAKDHEQLVKDLKEVKECIEQIEELGTKAQFEEKMQELIRKKPLVREVLEEVEKQDRLEQLHRESLKGEDEQKKTQKKKAQKKASPPQQKEKVETQKETPLPERNDPRNPDTPVVSSNDLGYKMNVKRQLPSGFKVIKVEDNKGEIYELRMVAFGDSKQEQERTKRSQNEKINGKAHFKPNMFHLTTSALREKIGNLPASFEYWEGEGFALAYLSYKAEESHLFQPWTEFTLILRGPHEICLKHIMILLLKAIVGHKMRFFPGWRLDVVDILRCIVAERYNVMEDLTITVQRGFNFEEQLSAVERKSLVNHQPYFKMDLLLIGIEKGDVPKILKADGGEAKMRKLMQKATEIKIYTGPLPKVDHSKLRKKLKKKRGQLARFDVLWEQMMQEPDNFEMYSLVAIGKEKELVGLGFKIINVRKYVQKKDCPVKICPACKAVDVNCDCFEPKPIDDKTEQFITQKRPFTSPLDSEDVPIFHYKDCKAMLDRRTWLAGGLAVLGKHMFELEHLEKTEEVMGLQFSNADNSCLGSSPKKMGVAKLKLLNTGLHVKEVDTECNMDGTKENAVEVTFTRYVFKGIDSKDNKVKPNLTFGNEVKQPKDPKVADEDKNSDTDTSGAENSNTEEDKNGKKVVTRKATFKISTQNKSQGPKKAESKEYSSTNPEMVDRHLEKNDTNKNREVGQGDRIELKEVSDDAESSAKNGDFNGTNEDSCNEEPENPDKKLKPEEGKVQVKGTKECKTERGNGKKSTDKSNQTTAEKYRDILKAAAALIVPDDDEEVIFTDADDKTVKVQFVEKAKKKASKDTTDKKEYSHALETVTETEKCKQENVVKGSSVPTVHSIDGNTIQVNLKLTGKLATEDLGKTESEMPEIGNSSKKSSAEGVAQEVSKKKKKSRRKKTDPVSSPSFDVLGSELEFFDKMHNTEQVDRLFSDMDPGHSTSSIVLQGEQVVIEKKTNHLTMSVSKHEINSDVIIEESFHTHPEVDGALAEPKWVFHCQQHGSLCPNIALHGAEIEAQTATWLNNREMQIRRAAAKKKKKAAEDNSDGESNKVKTCGNCAQPEPKKKTFKKCQKCKEEGVLNVRYYCTRECQLEDWRMKHKREHIEGLLG